MLRNSLTEFWDFIDTRFVVRRIMTFGTFLMTLYVIWWAMGFVEVTTRTGSEVSLIIAAVMVPLNTLMAYLFAIYTQGRKDA